MNDRNLLKKPTRNKINNPRKSYWLYGYHAVKSALNNPLRKLEHLLATPSAIEGLGTLPLTCPKPKLVSPRDLSALLPVGAVHQGVVAKAFVLSPISLDQVFSTLQTKQDCPILVLDRVTDPRNVGAILRSAAAFKSPAVIMQERHAPAESGAMAKAASGALDLVPIVRVTNLSRTLKQLASEGYWIIGLDHDGPTSLSASPINEPVALVLGGEGQGLRRLTRQHCDILSKIDIEKTVGSLNVSTSAAIALYELSKRR
jgi:23S rRNA (guanosine2251-2'-O)-methyltransferase